MKKKTKIDNVNENVKEQQAASKENLEEKVKELEAKVAELEDLKLRQMAEFDNFRRRTQKEKLELMDNAGERIFTDMLPLIDDFERALQHEQSEGVQLIYQKFQNYKKAKIHSLIVILLK